MVRPYSMDKHAQSSREPDCTGYEWEINQPTRVRLSWSSAANHGLHWALRRSQMCIHALLNPALLRVPGALRPPSVAPATARLPTLVQPSSPCALEGGTEQHTAILVIT